MTDDTCGTYIQLIKAPSLVLSAEYTMRTKKHGKHELKIVLCLLVLGISRLTQGPGELFFSRTEAGCGVKL